MSALSGPMLIHEPLCTMGADVVSGITPACPGAIICDCALSCCWVWPTRSRSLRAARSFCKSAASETLPSIISRWAR
jgi:hypothetical protein